MKRKLKLYLAHGLSTRHEVRKIELELEQKYGVVLHNPFYDSECRDDIENLDNDRTTDEIRNQFDMAHCWQIVRRDLKAIAKSDGILAYIIGNVGLGTAFEMGFVYYWTGMPLIVVSERYYNHPWLRCYADYLFKDQAEFEEFLLKYSSHPYRLLYGKFGKNIIRGFRNLKDSFFNLFSFVKDKSRDVKKPFKKIKRIRKSKNKIQQSEKDTADFYEMQKKFIGRL